jgi:hypothetical protein
MAWRAASTAAFSPRPSGGAHHGVAHAEHGGLHVGEIAVDDAGRVDDVADALHGLAQQIVGQLEGFEEAGAARHQRQQPVVGNGDDGVHGGGQLGQAMVGQAHAARAFEGERLGDHGDGERFQFLGQRGDDGRRAGAGAAAQSGADEHHVGALQQLDDLVGVLQAAWRPISGLKPAPSPLVILAPSCSLMGTSQAASAWASVFMAQNSTPGMPSRYSRATALQPPPPTPMTLMRAPPRLLLESRISNRRFRNR